MPIPTKRGITEKPFSTFPVQIELEHTREGFLFYIHNTLFVLCMFICVIIEIQQSLHNVGKV